MKIKPIYENSTTTLTFRKLKDVSIVDVDGNVTLNQLSDAIKNLSNIEKIVRSKHEVKSPRN